MEVGDGEEKSEAKRACPCHEYSRQRGLSIFMSQRSFRIVGTTAGGLRRSVVGTPNLGHHSVMPDGDMTPFQNREAFKCAVEV
jgi:hypothetical protein